MPDRPASSTRRLRLTPIPPGTPAVTAVPVAQHVLQRAMDRIGPEGVADLETRLAVAEEVRDETARGGALAKNGTQTRPLRLCTAQCEFRANGGPGCDFYKAAAAEAPPRALDGEQCERDLTLIRQVEQVFQSGDTERIREIAGRFTGAAFIEIQKLFDRIIADGAVVYHPVLDSQGDPVYTEEVALDGRGNVIRDRDQNPIMRKIPVTIPKEHPLYSKLIQLLRETRLIDLSQWQLTPKSSGGVPKTDGMILFEQTGGGRTTLAAIQGDLKKGIEFLREAQGIARAKREKDPAWIALREQLPAAVAATPSEKK